jgi:hypothetical protein
MCGARLTGNKKGKCRNTCLLLLNANPLFYAMAGWRIK